MVYAGRAPDSFGLNMYEKGLDVLSDELHASER
jgi:hypothetical protein